MNARQVSTFGRSLMMVASCAWGFGAVAVLADQSPATCNGNGITLNIARMPSMVLVGGVVTYSISIDNQDDPSIGLVACDADDVDVVFYCPGADGTPDLSMAQVLTTSLALPAGTPPMLVGGMPTCTINVNPGVFDAAASVIAGDQSGALDDLNEGRLHDGTVDHPFRSEKQLGTEVITTTTSTSTSSSTSSSTVTPTTSTTSTTQPVVCRTPGFWGTHAEANPRKPRSQDITGAFLPVTVCGVVLDNTDVGNSCSAQEALCVSPRSDQRLQLARQLTAARLNCEVATCPNAILTVLDACEQACSADDDPAAIGECIDDVDAFNNGVSADASGCHDRPIPGFQPSGPAGSSGDCTLAKENDRGSDPVNIFSADACP